MALKGTITREEYDALAEVLREHYKEAGDGFELQHDGVTKLKGSLDEKDKKLAEKDTSIRKLQEQINELKGSLEDIGDPAKAREALQRLEDLEKQELIEKGQFDKALDSERKKFTKQLDDLKAERETDQHFIEGLLVRDGMRKVLTAGRNGDGEELPKVRPGLMDGAIALLREAYKPRVVADGSDRKAVVTVDGIDRDLEEWLTKDWLTSESAKDWVDAPDNSGGFNGNNLNRTTSYQKGAKVIPAAEAEEGVGLEAIAKGEARIAD